MRNRTGRAVEHSPGIPVLDIRDISAHYEGRVALDSVSLRLAAGQRTAVVGPNGAGKSTLFKVIAGIHKPSSGSVRIYGAEPDRHVCIAYIEQHTAVNWRFPVTVEDVVAMGRIARIGYLRFPRRRDREIVTNAMARVSISGLRDRQIGELSGGQKQRMFIARALAQEAEIMLLDEPFSGLDVDASRRLEETLEEIGDAITVMVATHDLGVAERLGHVVLLNRCLIALGSPAEVLVEDRLSEAYAANLRRIDRDGTVYALPDSHCDRAGTDLDGPSSREWARR